MQLYTETTGTGPDLVLIHGWGLHGGIWGRLMPWLEGHFTVTRVDLPGHGRSPAPDNIDLDVMVQAVLDVTPENAAWLGWSLGGLVAASAAIHASARINHLVLVAGTPCFTRQPGWDLAMLPALLESFAQELELDYAKTLNRFLSLQVRGSEDATETLRELRAGLLAHGEPDPVALQAGLAILRSTDLRAGYGQIRCPVLFMMGERDTLVPAAAASQAASLIGKAQVEIVDGCGHALFIPAPEIFSAALCNFLLEKNKLKQEEFCG